MFLVLSDFIPVASNFSSTVSISLIFFLVNIWSWHNLLPLFVLSPPFPKSWFFYFLFNACLILERKTEILTAFLSLPNLWKIYFLYFQLWPLNGCIFQDEASLGASVAPWPSPDSHPVLLTMPCLQHGLFSFLPQCLWSSNPKPLFSLWACCVCICFFTTLSWMSCCFSRSSSSKMELLLLLPKMPSLPPFLYPQFSLTCWSSVLGLVFLTSFSLLRLSLILFAYSGIFKITTLF